MANKTISELNPATLSNDLAMIVEGSTETQKTTIAELKAFVGADKQDTSNLVTSLSAESIDTQYPSAKCVYDLLGDVETLLSQI